MAILRDWLCYQLVLRTPLWFAGNPYAQFGRWCLVNAGNWAYRGMNADGSAHLSEEDVQ